MPLRREGAWPACNRARDRRATATRVLATPAATWRCVMIGAMALTLAGCPDDWLDAPAPMPLAPPPVAVLIVPDAVDFAADAAAHRIALRALVRHADGSIRVPAPGAITWKIAPFGAGVAVAGLLPGFGQIALSAAPPSVVSVRAELTANPPLTAVATLLRQTSIAGHDRVTASAHEAFEIPRVAIAGPVGGGDCATTVATAFVMAGDLGALPPSGPCGFGAIFSARVAPWYADVAWTSGSETIAEPAAAPYVITARVVMALSQPWCDTSGWFSTCYTLDEIRGFAAANLEVQRVYANGVLRANRAGIRIEFDPATVRPMPGLVGCSTVPAPDNASWTPAPGRLTIYVVEQLTDLPRAVTCHNTSGDDAPDAPYKVILVAYHDALLASTLVHELGHALGLRWPQHVNDDGVTGFGAHNVMASVGLTDPERFDFTLGQVFRMVADEASWLNASGLRAAGLPRKACQCDGAPGPRTCPLLALALPAMPQTGAVAANACYPR